MPAQNTCHTPAVHTHTCNILTHKTHANHTHTHAILKHSKILPEHATSDSHSLTQTTQIQVTILKLKVKERKETT